MEIDLKLLQHSSLLFSPSLLLLLSLHSFSVVPSPALVVFFVVRGSLHKAFTVIASTSPQAPTAFAPFCYSVVSLAASGVFPFTAAYNVYSKVASCL